MDDATLQFAQTHMHGDTVQLLLQSARYPHIDMRAAVQQIEGLRTAAEKWPSLLEHPGYWFPPRLNREQSSSEATARYKAERVPAGARVADLTGGMGIDTLAFARVAEHVDYVERDENLCALMRHNLQELCIDNVTVHCADSMEWLSSQLAPQSRRPQFSIHNSQFTIIYIDPARRSGSRKVSAFEDCTPNLLEHIDLLRECGETLVVKASPMIDLQLAMQQLGTVADLHVVAVCGECKEVLLECRQQCEATTLHCVNLQGDKTDTFSFYLEEERQAEARYCSWVGAYLYEPHAALMKGGAYKLIAQRYGLAQLDANSHLYTSEEWVQHFPGRVFRVVQPVKLSRVAIKEFVPEGCAHVVTRNYPVAAADLQRQLGLREGGNRYLFATTVAGRRCGFLCERLDG